MSRRHHRPDPRRRAELPEPAFSDTRSHVLAWERNNAENFGGTDRCFIDGKLVGYVHGQRDEEDAFDAGEFVAQGFADFTIGSVKQSIHSDWDETRLAVEAVASAYFKKAARA